MEEEQSLWAVLKACKGPSSCPSEAPGLEGHVSGSEAGGFPMPAVHVFSHTISYSILDNLPDA